MSANSSISICVIFINMLRIKFRSNYTPSIVNQQLTSRNVAVWLNQERKWPSFFYRALHETNYATRINQKNAVFWDVTPCGSVINRRFGGTCRLHLQGRRNNAREEKCYAVPGHRRENLRSYSESTNAFRKKQNTVTSRALDEFDVQKISARFAGM
jgi:hypothetical protein